jgi:hypothetical protein
MALRRIHKIGVFKGWQSARSVPVVVPALLLGSWLGWGAWSPQAAGAAAATVTTYTWTGADSAAGVSPFWSDAKNWKGGVAPTAGSTISLNFPVLSCTSTGPCGNNSLNDLNGLNVSKLTIHIGQGTTQPSPGFYEMGGNSISVRSMSIATVTVPSGHIGNLADISLPITVPHNEAWSVNVTGDGQPEFVGSITGPGNLTVDSTGQGFIDFDNIVNVGTLSFVGTNSSDTGHTAFLNGTIAMNGVSMNSNGHPFSLTNVGFVSFVGGTIGPLTTSGANMQLGHENATKPLGTYSIDGNGVLDANSVISDFSLTPGTGTQPVAGTDYFLVSASGTLALNSAALTLFADCNQPLGKVYKFVKATGGFTGTFAALANGTVVQTQADGSPSCSVTGATAPYVKIAYNHTANVVSATVVKAPATPATPALSATAHPSWHLETVNGQTVVSAG